MEPKKYNKLVTITKKKQIHNSKEQTSGYQWGEGRGSGKIGVGDQEVQTLRYKINYNDILYSTGNVASIL